LDELEIYRRAFSAISAENFEGAVRATLDAMVAATGADRGFLLAPAADDEGEARILARTTARAGAPAEVGPSDAIVRRALEARAPVRIENALDDPTLRGRPSVLAISVLSVLAVPILASDGEPLALVYLDSVRLAGIFSAEAEATAARLAAAVAPGIRAAARIKESGERELGLRRRLEELEGARAPGILGRSPAFVAALDRALKAAPSDAPILLHGESGTGKELFARAIHRASRRALRPFVAINCGALPEGTLEAELFGYLRGAFTGAAQDRAGRFEAAHEGTIFLDEIGDTPPALQVKLLRVLQSGEIQKLGESRDRRVDVRVVAATHRDLRALVKEGRFREDLFYRLRVIAVDIPPLRERGSDVAAIAESLAQRFGREQKKSIAGLSPGAREALLRHPFPGNVRELENAIRHAVVFATGPRLALGDLPVEIAGAGAEAAPAPGAEAGRAAPRDAEELRKAKEDASARIERAFLGELLERAGGNVSMAARIAGMNRSVLYEMIDRHGVVAGEYKK
jgi:transcriptional regulator with GAF, ATPase, and Fis domain